MSEKESRGWYYDAINPTISQDQFAWKYDYRPDGELSFGEQWSQEYNPNLCFLPSDKILLVDPLHNTSECKDCRDGMTYHAFPAGLVTDPNPWCRRDYLMRRHSKCSKCDKPTDFYDYCWMHGGGFLKAKHEGWQVVTTLGS